MIIATNILLLTQPYLPFQVWFQNTRARDRREKQLAFNTFPTPPASCSTGSQKHPSPAPSPQPSSQANFQEEEEKIPLDLSTKSSTPSASPPPLVINSEADSDDDEDLDDDDEELEENNSNQKAFTSRPPIDIEQLAKQHFDNMIRAKLGKTSLGNSQIPLLIYIFFAVTLKPNAEAMLPDAPVAPSSEPVTSSGAPSPPAAKKSKKASSSSNSSNSGASDPTQSSSNSATANADNGNQTIYSCDQCDKTFTKKSSITRHKYEHSGNAKMN